VSEHPSSPGPARADSCRELCLRGGEPLVGSAAPTPFWIALSWPKPRWHPDKALLSDGLPESLRQLEKEVARTGQKLGFRLFQRGTTTSTERVELVLWRAGAAFGAREVALEQSAEIIRAFVAGERPEGTEPLGRELFVCTDGKHDACCASHGYALYTALRDELARRGAAVRVAECSHLGGHRFAATCAALPAGELYGRLEPADVPALIDAVVRGEVLLPRFRGRLGRSELAQIAESMVRERTRHGGAIEVLDTRQEDTRAWVSVRLDDGRSFATHCEQRSYHGPGSCGEAPGVEKRWVALDLHEQ